MLKKIVAQGPGGRVMAMDSITMVTLEDAGAIVVSGSHGGASSGAYALEVPLRAAFFNDAGIGKDEAGVVALQMLQSSGVAAGTVSHRSARIGDARDCWENGVISRCNAAARALGIEPGMSLRVALSGLVSR